MGRMMSKLICDCCGYLKGKSKDRCDRCGAPDPLPKNKFTVHHVQRAFRVARLATKRKEKRP